MPSRTSRNPAFATLVAASTAVSAGCIPGYLVHETPGPVTLTGRLGEETVSGAWCAWLTDANGRRVDVDYPDGWRLRRDPVRLLDPSGTVVAMEGDLVTVTGPEVVGFSACATDVFHADSAAVLDGAPSGTR